MGGVHGRYLTVVVRDEFIRTVQAGLDGTPEKAFIDYALEIMDTQPIDIFEVSE
jgi:hypothetical protein